MNIANKEIKVGILEVMKLVARIVEFYVKS